MIGAHTLTPVTTVAQQTFAALSIPNYRRYVRGKAVSLVGTWMQSIAQSWLVLELTGSATALGIVLALQMLPTLVLGPYAGVVADRWDKRRLMIGLQATMGALALLLGLLTVTGTVQLWHVYVLAFLLGMNNCFENPARQAFVHGAGRARRPAQRREPELGAGQRGPRRRPRDRRHRHRHRRPGPVLPAQRA